MPRFEFRLKSVLALRYNERDQRRAELAAAFATEREIIERQRSLEADRERLRQWVRDGAAPGAVDAGKLRTAGTYEASLRAQLAQTAENLESAAATVARCQQTLAVADGEVRTLEKLRDRQHDAFRHAQELAESKHLDEVAARVHQRSLRSA